MSIENTVEDRKVRNNWAGRVQKTYIRRKTKLPDEDNYSFSELREVEISCLISYGDNGSDKYSLIFEGQQVIATAEQKFDDGNMDWGETTWRAVFPSDLVKKALDELNREGRSKLELITKVAKKSNNRFASYSSAPVEEKVEYEYPVKILMQKFSDAKNLLAIDLMIWFQKNMEIYF